MTTGQFPKRKGKVLVAANTADPGIRYHDFAVSLMNLKTHMKDRADVNIMPGVNVTDHCNKACEMTVEGEYDAMWLIADDHVFAPEIIDKLEGHNKNVIVPHCLMRVPPYQPVLYSHSEGEEGEEVHWVAEIPETGLMKVHACGSAGMLVRRSVLEAMEPPWFRTYGKQNEDLMFCKRLREESGEDIWCDVNVALGHIGLVCVFPISLTHPMDGSHIEWGVDLSIGATDAGQNVQLRRIGDSLTPPSYSKMELDEIRERGSHPPRIAVGPS